MKKDPKKIADEAVKYLDSPEGRKAFEKSFAEAVEFTEELERKRQVTREELEEEMTI